MGSHDKDKAEGTEAQKNQDGKLSDAFRTRQHHGEHRAENTPSENETMRAVNAANRAARGE